MRAVLLSNAAYWEEGDPEFARARTRLYHVEPVLYRRYLGLCDDIAQLLTRALAAHRGTRPEEDVMCEVVAAAAVGAWRAGITAWLASGGDLKDHVAAGLEIVEPMVRANAKPPKKAAGRTSRKPRASAGNPG